MQIRKLFRKFNNNFNKEDLLEEISDLNQQVAKLMKEKDELMAMKVSQLGLKPGESNILNSFKLSSTKSNVVFKPHAASIQ